MNRGDFEKLEGLVLAPYATRSADSRGRVHPEAEHAFRLSFQRDRDRIIHSTAFRRLEYKTQVFVNHEGDYYRTRLTHSMETAQIARTVAQALRLNQDLAEAVALAHDLGHTPFGHAGERTLHQLMRDHGGFDHNRQSLRIVEVLEERYPSFKGLNLTWEVREGIAKHSPPYTKPMAQRFEPGKAPCLEAQLVDYADEIAYNTHDIDDGLKSGLITAEQLSDVALWRDTYARVVRELPDAPFELQRYQVQRWLIDEFVGDLIGTIEERLTAIAAKGPEDIRDHGAPIATFSDALESKRLELKAFLKENMYRHYRVTRMMVKAQRVMAELFKAYMEEPRLLPPHVLARSDRDDTQARVIADYIAGMTDRFAVEEHIKLFDPSERV